MANWQEKENQFADHEGEAHENEIENKEKKNVTWPKVLGKIFSIKIPLWLITIVAVAISGYVVYIKFTGTTPVNLRPYVTESDQLKISVTMCNEDVDSMNLDVRKAELKLQDKFERVENVDEAIVEIKRKNCN